MARRATPTIAFLRIFLCHSVSLTQSSENSRTLAYSRKWTQDNYYYNTGMGLRAIKMATNTKEYHLILLFPCVDIHEQENTSRYVDVNITFQQCIHYNLYNNILAG